MYRIGQRVFRTLITSGKYKGRPKCIVEGCNSPGQDLGMFRKDGSVMYRAKCMKHHSIQYGMGDYAYRRYKKEYCENTDGRLGFVCTTTIIDSCQLDLDHANNNHEDNRIENCDTLCSSCHNYKTKYFGHYKELSTIRRLYAQNTKHKRKNKV